MIVFDVVKRIYYNKKEVGSYFLFHAKYHFLLMMTADRFVNLLLKVFKVLFENILPRDVKIIFQTKIEKGVCMHMANGLKQYFPMIREKAEILSDIQKSDLMRKVYESWNQEQQEVFISYCTGMRGIKLLYDTFFKELFNPDTTPERLEELLSIIMQQKVKILYVLPNESSRIAAENSLLILDIVVQLEDGSIANVECQRIGYAFPGQRCACYSADLLLRQYKRVRGDKGSEFSYKDIKKVYTIVFFEKSPKQFKSFKKKCTYIHRSRQQFDTGVKMDLLQEYIFINLDIFRYKLDNNNVDIENELEAWLTFLSVDEPDIIIKLLEKYPRFRILYEEVYYLCLNVEKVMRMFSKELLELDKNTVQYMIDEMQEEINAQKMV